MGRGELKRVERVLGESLQFVKAVAFEERNESAQEGFEKRLDVSVLGRRLRVKGAVGWLSPTWATR